MIASFHNIAVFHYKNQIGITNCGKTMRNHEACSIFHQLFHALLITFENVHFGYTEDKIVINDFSMYIKPGKKIAIVGPTGAGKTTIVKLLDTNTDISDITDKGDDRLH